jgi:hypothetical protein
MFKNTHGAFRSFYTCYQKIRRTSPPKKMKDMKRTKSRVRSSLMESELPSPSNTGLLPIVLIGSLTFASSS